MTKFMRILAMASSFVIGGAFSAHSGEVTQAAQKVEDLLSSNQPLAAYGAVEELSDMVWAKLPMKIRNAQYVQEIYAFRRFKSKEAPVFKPNESHIIYAEPIGFTYGKDANGNKEAGFLIDFTLTSDSGKVLLQRADFLKIDLPLGANNKEVHLNLTVDLTGLPVGKYQSHYVVKDKHSEKSDKISLPFSIAK